MQKRAVCKRELYAQESLTPACSDANGAVVEARESCTVVAHDGLDPCMLMHACMQVHAHSHTQAHTHTHCTHTHHLHSKVHTHTHTHTHTLAVYLATTHQRTQRSECPHSRKAQRLPRHLHRAETLHTKHPRRSTRLPTCMDVRERGRKACVDVCR